MTAVDTLVRRRRRSLALITFFLLAVLLVTGGAILVGPTIRSPDQVAADAAPPPPSVVTARAERRKLVEPVVLRGRIEPGRSVPVLPPATALGPNSVVTRVPARTGDRAVEGRVLVERSGEPMFAMALPFPLYRDLTAGARGPDVVEVQRAMRRIGYPVPVSGMFDGATQRQVNRLYRERGYPDGPAAAALPPDGAGSSERPGETARPDQQHGVRLPQSAVLVVDRSGRRISKVHARVGQSLTDPKTVLLELDGQAPTIVATAAADQAELLRAGQQAEVTDEIANARTTATVNSVGRKVVTGPDGQSGFEVRFRFTGLNGDPDRSVRLDVRVTPAAEVLAVPVSAIYSRPDGSTFVTVVTETDGAVDVAVTTGHTAGGWVELREPVVPPLADGVQVATGEQTGGG